MERVSEYERSLKNVEEQLIQTKLALVESQCVNQTLVHQVGCLIQAPNKSMQTLFQISKNTSGDNAWLKKTINVVRDVGNSIKNNAAAAATTPTSIGEAAAHH